MAWVGVGDWPDGLPAMGPATSTERHAYTCHACAREGVDLGSYATEEAARDMAEWHARVWHGVEGVGVTWTRP